MSRFILRWFITGLAIILASYVIPGIYIESTGALIMAALVLGLLNSIVRPILIILTLPITFVTLGLFLLVINAFTLWLAARIVPGFGIEGVSYIWTALVITLTSWLLNLFVRKEERGRRHHS